MDIDGVVVDGDLRDQLLRVENQIIQLEHRLEELRLQKKKLLTGLRVRGG